MKQWIGWLLFVGLITLGTKQLYDGLAVTGNSTFSGSGLFGGSTIATDAILEAQGTTKGVLIPRLTTTERDAISTPTTGLFVYNTTLKALQRYDGASWTDWDMEKGRITTDLSVGTSSDPNASSILDTVSTSKGTRPCPTMTEAQRDAISTPATGLCVFNSTTLKYNSYNGTSWEALSVSTPLYWDLNIGGAEPDLGTSNVSTYTGITHPTLDLVINSGSETAQILCAGTTSPSGLTCSGADESIGVAVTIGQTGVYEACFSFQHQPNVTGSSAEITTTFQVVETATNAQTILQEGKTRLTSGYTTSVSGTSTVSTIRMPVHVCGLLVFASTGTKGIRLFFEQTVAGAGLGSSLKLTRDAANGQRDLHITIRKWN